MTKWWRKYRRSGAEAMHSTRGYQSERLYRVGFEAAAELAAMGILI